MTGKMRFIVMCLCGCVAVMIDTMGVVGWVFKEECFKIYVIHL